MKKNLMERTRLGSLIVGFIAFFVAACGGGGGGNSNSNTPPTSIPAPVAPSLPDPASAPALKTQFAPYFKIGAAVERMQIDTATNATDVALLKKHYSSMTPANAMKADTIGVSEGQYNFTPADELIAFAEANGLAVRAHTLVWYVTSPQWFFTPSPADLDKTDPAAYRAQVQQRLRTYITDVVTHFKGKVYAWDVVNEVAGETAASRYRTDSPWYRAYSVGGANGADYIEDAFRAARAADPDVQLFLNDYSTEWPDKRQNVMAIVKDLIDKGVPINGVGHQVHANIYLQASQVDAALTAVEQISSTLTNEITELDLSVYNDPFSNFGLAGPAQAILTIQALAYRDLFKVFLKHDASIDGVTTWGISDAQTWLSYLPINRIDRPLLFDRDGNPKWAFWAIVDPTIKLP
jgi:endo-1,4-beta-xylanase